VERILENVNEFTRRTDIVSETTNWCGVSCHVILLPLSKKTNNKVSFKLLVEDLREEVEIGDESSLENDGDV
jgi:hypothetical protein